jgi:DNA replication and repair protein RecF
MQLRSLYLHNFRSYDEAFFEFNPGINTICGPNASGKTTLLEAIYFLICGRSFRRIDSIDLIREGAGHFHLDASFLKNDLEQRLKLSWSSGEKRIAYNSTVYPNFSSLLGWINGIVFCPDDVALIKGAPAIRRHYLDLQIAQVDPLYVHHFARYNKAMRQRNFLLRSKKTTAIESWELEMSHSAAYLTEQRYRAVTALKDICKPLYSLLTEQAAAFLIHYKCSAPVESGMEEIKAYYLKRYQQQRTKELKLGVTLNGPHRDDLAIEIDGREVRYFGSEGQQRSAVAALRLAEWERVKACGAEIPILLIDDVGTSLDEVRLNCLLNYVKGLGQVFLTATKPLQLDSHIVDLLR